MDDISVENPPAPDALLPRLRILFVDDEPSMLDLLRAGMSSMEEEWEMEFAASGEEALTKFQQNGFDAVVTDMRMPGMNGGQLLSEIWKLRPETIRMIISGNADWSDVVSYLGIAHQFLSKPFHILELRDSLRVLAGDEIRSAYQKVYELTTSLKNLPELSKTATRITEEIRSPNTTIDSIAKLVSTDPPLAAKLLQLCNSSYFGFARQISSVDDAVQMLGVSIIQSLSLAVPTFAIFDPKEFHNFPIEQIWQHSSKVGSIGRQLFSHHRRLAEQAFAAGLLHDVGKVILAHGMPKEYSKVYLESQNTGTPLYMVEEKYFHTNHAKVGAYLLKLWGLPDALVEAVACHHKPQRCGVHKMTLAGVVHISNALQHIREPWSTMTSSPVDAEYLKLMKLEGDFAKWSADTDIDIDKNLLF